MPDDVRLAAETRTEFGKGGARRTRRAGKVPAVIYGGGADPRHVSLPAHELAAAIRNGGSNVLMTLDLEGGEQLVIPKSIVRHPIKGYFEHLDLLQVKRGQKVTVDVPVEVTGEVVPGGLVNIENTSISVEAEATNIPSGFSVSIDDLEIGSQILASQVQLTDGATLDSDPELLLVAIAEAPTAEDLEAEVAEAAEALGIEEDAPESDEDEATDGGEPAEGAEGEQSSDDE